MDHAQKFVNHGRKFQFRNLRHRRALALTVLTLTILAHQLHTRLTRTEIDSHLARLEYLRTGPFLKPRSARAWFSHDAARYLQWTTRQWLANQPDTFDHWINALESEQQALVTLGHYQRLWLNLPATNALAKLTPPPREILPRFTLHYHNGRPTQIRVTARPDQIHQLTAALASLPRE
jgi:hypothetical protein